MNYTFERHFLYVETGTASSLCSNWLKTWVEARKLSLSILICCLHQNCTSYSYYCCVETCTAAGQLPLCWRPSLERWTSQPYQYPCKVSAGSASVSWYACHLNCSCWWIVAICRCSLCFWWHGFEVICFECSRTPRRPRSGISLQLFLDLIWYPFGCSLNLNSLLLKSVLWQAFLKS